MFAILNLAILSFWRSFNYENFIKCLLLKLAEKYKKEIVDMAINLPRDEDEVVDTETKQNKETE